MTDYQQLRELAERATPGPWDWEESEGVGESASVYSLNYALGGYHHVAGEYGEVITNADAEYMAYTSPEVIQGLLGEVDRLRAENYLLRQGRGGTPETHTANDRTPLHLTHPIENSQETA